NGFNGATAFRPWKRTSSRRAHWMQPFASMEPQPSGRGNIPSDWHSISVVVLQWSHSLPAVETISFWVPAYHSARATMETPPSRRGNPKALTPQHYPLKASMEPQPSGRGNAKQLHAPRHIHDALQWSHSLPAVETATY